MADVKISALPAASTPLTGAEVLPVVQSGVTTKVAVSNLTAGLAGTASININGTVGATTPTTGAFTSGTFSTTLGVTTGAAVGGATPGAGGLAFPATAVAVADANTLDDYEEGTWTPNQGSGLTVVGAFSSTGTYTKIGRQVTVLGTVSGSTSIAVGAAGIITGNMPFTVGANSGVGSATNAGLTASIATLANTTTTDMYACTAIVASSTMRFSATYFI